MTVRKNSVSNRALLAALALGLAVPLAPLSADEAQAASVRKAKPRKAAARKVCTVTRVKGRKVTRCRTVRVKAAAAPALPAPTIVPQPLSAAQGPAIVHVSTLGPEVGPLPPQSAINPADYYYIDQADSLARAFGTSPPDFTFDCDGIDCWAWLSRDGELLIVEPGRQGVQQFFFAPRQAAPYLVRDAYNSFAFSGRELLVVYAGDGRVLPGGASPRDRDLAAALRERGAMLYAMSLRQRRWDRGSADAWIGSYGSLGYDDGWNYGWNPFWREIPSWEIVRRSRHPNHPPRHLDDEHRDRDNARRRYDDWHRRGGPGAPPPTGNPVVTPTDGAGSPNAGRPRPGWQPRPAPGPVAPPPVIAPPPQGGIVAPPAPLPAPVPAAEAPRPRPERPRREIEPEPGAPPIPMRRARPEPYAAPAQPVAPVAAAPVAVPVPPPAPVIVAAPVPAPAPAPMPAPMPAPVRIETPPPPPPPPPSPPPPREQIRLETPDQGADHT